MRLALDRVARWCLGAWTLLGAAVEARAASPVLEQILPRGVTRGTEAVLTLSGARLADAEDLLFLEDGLSLLKLEATGPNQVKARVKVAEACRLGEHALRVRARGGISELRTFFVGPFPTVDEVEPNGDFAKPQKIPLNVTVSGVVRSEDVDHFAFEARKGQRVAAEIEGMRLSDGVFDPYIAILDSRRFEIASCDDSTLLGQDAAVSCMIPEDGTYVVLVREAAYGGNDGCLYRLHVGTFPRPLAVFPPGGKEGEELEVTLLGDPSGDVRRKVLIPAGGPPGFDIFPEDEGGVAPSPNPMRASPFGNVLEVEPNDAKEEATPAAAPAALNGVISKDGDIDHFRVPLKKGEVVDVGVWARRVRSPLDPVLAILDPGGAVLAANDDAVGLDSQLRFTAPEDKEYIFRVGDHLGKGGPCHVYRVEIAPVRPEVLLAIPKAGQFSQERQAVVVPRGNRYATLISANRADFGGELALAVDGLPQGVTVELQSVPAGAAASLAVFEAAPDAPVGGGFVRLTAKAVDPNPRMASRFSQEVELVVGGPGQSVYWRYETDRLAAAVAEEAPFRLRVVEPRVPLLQNGSMALKVVAERASGFKGPIQLQVPFVPPGVSAGGGVAIPEGQSEAAIPVNAGGGAPTRAWKIVVLGLGDAGAGPVWVSSQLAQLQVAPPYFTLQVDRGSIEQGKETQVVCKVEQLAPFEGAARVELVGLPPKVTAPPVEVRKDTTELSFRISADPQSPPGQHKGIFCRVELVRDGESMVYGSGGTELRVDPPPPPKPSEPPARAVAERPPDKPPEAPPQPPKPLSRLEKLRLEAQGQKETPR